MSNKNIELNIKVIFDKEEAEKKIKRINKLVEQLNYELETFPQLQIVQKEKNTK